MVLIKSNRYVMTMSRTVIKSKCLSIFLGNPQTQKVKHRGTESTERKTGGNEKRDLALAKGFENEIQRPFDRYGLKFASDVGVNITHRVLFRSTRRAVF